MNNCGKTAPPRRGGVSLLRSYREGREFVQAGGAAAPRNREAICAARVPLAELRSAAEPPSLFSSSHFLERQLAIPDSAGTDLFLAANKSAIIKNFLPEGKKFTTTIHY